MNIQTFNMAHACSGSNTELRRLGRRLRKMIDDPASNTTLMDLIETLYRQNGWGANKRHHVLWHAGIKTSDEFTRVIESILRDTYPPSSWVEYELRGRHTSGTLAWHFGFGEIPSSLRIQCEKAREQVITPTSD